jgi:hypothetical protein
MILSKTIKIKTGGNKKIKHYKSLGYDTSLDYIEVRIEDLPKSIGDLVLVKCDYCDWTGEKKFVDYNRVMSKSIGDKYACSRECGYKKSSESLLGKESPNLGKKIPKDKLEVILNKRRETNLERWGVEHPLQNGEILKKYKETNLERWGVDNFSKTEIFKSLIIESSLEKWGVSHPMKSPNILKGMEVTNLERWGVKSTLQIEKSKRGRSSRVNSKKWRMKYNISNDPNYINYLGESKSLFNCDLGEEHEFIIKYDNYWSRENLGLPICTNCYPIDKKISIGEDSLYKFIKEVYNGDVIRNWRLGGLELDIYLPDLNIGFEYNGLWWHSDVYKEKDYHLDKTKYFESNRIRVIHIWEDDWRDRDWVIKSQISNTIGVNKKIWARNCIIKTIDDIKIIREFLEKNHIQGWVKSDIKIGLFHNGDLVSLMTFDRFEGRKRMGDCEWNLNRFCNKIGHSVIGGASKLLKYFIREMNPKRIISYADRDWSRGDLYSKLGFTLSSITNPDYRYLFENKLIHKSRFRKSRTGISESKLGLPKVWNCGKLKFEVIL